MPTGQVCKVFAHGPGDWVSIPGQVIINTHNNCRWVSLLNTQHYKVHIKGKDEQSREECTSV